MARRLGDRVALGYALNARMHALWGIGPAPERLATGTELGEIADEIGDELLALHGHMWRIRELLAQGDVDAVNEEIARFRARDTGPVHPLEESYAFNVAAMMALLAGDFETAEQLGRGPSHVAEGHNELALSFYGALMRGRGGSAASFGRARTATSGTCWPRTPARYPTVSAALALVHAEAGDTEAALGQLRPSWRPSDGTTWPDDQAEGVSLALAAAACSVIGRAGEPLRAQCTRRCGPMPAPPSWSGRRRRHAWGRPTTISGSWRRPWATWPWRRCTTRRPCGWPAAWAPPPSWPRPKSSWPGPCAGADPAADKERVAVLLRSAEEAARAMGLHRLAQRAAAPD